MRIQTSFPGTARLTENPDHSDETSVTVMDISDTGALIKAPILFGEVGEHIYLTMSTEIDNEASEITVQSRIAHSRLSSTQDSYLIGLAFKNVSAHDKMVLHFLSRV
jgi:c-di-GMP-binding flagellar brake protein YcgR